MFAPALYREQLTKLTEDVLSEIEGFMDSNEYTEFSFEDDNLPVIYWEEDSVTPDRIEKNEDGKLVLFAMGNYHEKEIELDVLSVNELLSLYEAITEQENA